MGRLALGGDPQFRQEMEKAQGELEANRGALARSLAAVEALLQPAATAGRRFKSDDEAPAPPVPTTVTVAADASPSELHAATDLTRLLNRIAQGSPVFTLETVTLNSLLWRFGARKCAGPSLMSRCVSCAHSSSRTSRAPPS